MATLPPSAVDEATLSVKAAVELLGRLLLNSINKQIQSSASSIFITFINYQYTMIVSLLRFKIAAETPEDMLTKQMILRMLSIFFSWKTTSCRTVPYLMLNPN